VVFIVVSRIDGGKLRVKRVKQVFGLDLKL
jgi:hypothetical protein